MKYENLYNLIECANLLHMKVRTMRAWVNNGKLHGIKIGKSWMVRESEIMRIRGERDVNED